MKMTAEQQRLVTENIRFVQWVLNRSFRDRRYDPDWQSEAYYIFCRAATEFDPSKGVKFTTFASKVLHRQLTNFMRENCAKKSLPPTKIEALSDVSRDDPADPIDDLDTAERDEVVAALLESLPLKYRRILKMRYGFGREPMTFAQIARIDNRSKQAIWQK